jgi:hypothetical protein
LGVFVCDGPPAGGWRQRRRVFGGSPTRGCLVKGKGAACVGFGRRAEHLRRRVTRIIPGAIAKWDTREAKKSRKVLQNGGKLVPNARGDADCARAQEGGGRSEARVLLSVLSSWDTRGQTARYGALRRRSSFLAAAAPRVESNCPIRRSS